ncbi:Protein-arginine-phosphatase [Candidatus Hydrogenisulfobacillus filiaventi]|uniref:Protein-arginine-phosphatase n=1 Tax=Candidatus Hydrogenisulfobacillus filiaventi TaxID=2707344 RepID=A0A6F8ZER3_9FIRM|nr:Protein-arginine-phosphatase [Candidatus Hydrogenisulfobacillus filiaventi]
MTTAIGRILFVCSGNTCRSPMAQALWAVKGTGVAAESAGVHAWPGQPATREAVQAVRAYGASLEAHRSRGLDQVTADPDLVLTMTAGQARAVAAARPEWAGRVHPLTAYVGETGDIPDPIGQGDAAYRDLARELWRLLDRLAARLAADNHGSRPPPGPFSG